MQSSLALVLFCSESCSITVQVLDCSGLWPGPSLQFVAHTVHCLVSFTSNLHPCMLWIPCFPAVIIILYSTDLSML